MLVVSSYKHPSYICTVTIDDSILCVAFLDFYFTYDFYTDVIISYCWGVIGLPNLLKGPQLPLLLFHHSCWIVIVFNFRHLGFHANLALNDKLKTRSSINIRMWWRVCVLFLRPVQLVSIAAWSQFKLFCVELFYVSVMEFVEQLQLKPSS